MRLIKLFPVKLLFLIILFPTNLSSQEYQADFPPEEFKQRRDKVFDYIGEDAIAFLPGAPDPGGFVYPRQTNNFYYLSGVENSYSYLLLDGRTRTTTLYLAPNRPRGWKNVLSTEDIDYAKKLTGVDEVKAVSGIELPSVRKIYTFFSPAEGAAQQRYELNARNRTIANDKWDGRISREQNLVALLKTRYPDAGISDLTPLLDEMRSIKSPREIELMRKAGELSALALVEAMKSSEPGVYEYELDAAARYVFLVNGARLEAYRSITASGVKNISDGHYYYNSSQLKDGDLVLMDYAPDYRYYSSDIGRMWPVNGRFNDWQRELCTYILEYHKAILSRIRPGVSAETIMDEAKTAMQPVIEEHGFSKPEYRAAVIKMIETGGGVFSHPVGMAVHDDGGYRKGPLKPGQVFAVDPQLWVPEENLYMRVEDTVVITEDACENLTSKAPIELDEIEKMVKRKGIVQDKGIGK
ncbi:MAG: Xaa-Pro peptidase family protein [Marinilabiliaceae bacterium]|jgi:Xaa-Pro aminopeptidase|nr:Xaa-Pro peptidase family protein [Marinilabiliaceae bacterium]